MLLMKDKKNWRKKTTKLQQTSCKMSNFLHGANFTPQKWTTHNKLSTSNESNWHKRLFLKNKDQGSGSGSGSRIRIKDQDQGSRIKDQGSGSRIKDQDQGSRIKDHDQWSGSRIPYLSPIDNSRTFLAQFDLVLYLERILVVQKNIRFSLNRLPNMYILSPRICNGLVFLFTFVTNSCCILAKEKQHVYPVTSYL